MSKAHKSKVEGIGSIAVFHISPETETAEAEKIQVRRNGSGPFIEVDGQRCQLKFKGKKEPSFRNDHFFLLHREGGKWLKFHRFTKNCGEVGNVPGHEEYILMRGGSGKCDFTVADEQEEVFSGSWIGPILVVDNIIPLSEVRNGCN